jgi:hypothetical protein
MKRGQGGNNPPPAIAYAVMEESTKFKFLSADLGITLKYRLNNLTFHFIPSYAIPFNAATFNTENVISKENIKNSFYYNVGINFIL